MSKNINKEYRNKSNQKIKKEDKKEEPKNQEKYNKNNNSEKEQKTKRKPEIEKVKIVEPLNYDQLNEKGKEESTSNENILKNNSLVSYETPFLVNSTLSNKKLLEELDASNENAELVLKRIIYNNTMMDYSLKDTLNKILPPLKVKNKDQTWVRYVSSDPVTKDRVTQLRDELNKKLISEKAHLQGICPIKKRLYNECFDELIRQITINCLERGIVLMRVKEEAEMNINTYQKLYESSVAYAMRVFLRADLEKKTNRKKILKLTNEYEIAKNEAEKLEKELKEIMTKEKEEYEDTKKKHNEFVTQMQRDIYDLKTLIKEKLDKKTL